MLVLKGTFLGSTEHKREGNFPKEVFWARRKSNYAWKTKAEINNACLSPLPTSLDILQYRFSCWRPFINSILCFLNTTKSSLNPLRLRGLINETIIFSPLMSWETTIWRYSNIFRHIDILSLRLKKQQLIAKRILFMATIKNDFLYIILRKYQERHCDLNKTENHFSQYFIYSKSFVQKTCKLE